MRFQHLIQGKAKVQPLSGEIVELKEEEVEIFEKNLKFLKSQKRVKMVFRGNSNLQEQYKVDESSISILAERIFMVGEKAAAFWDTKKSKLEIITESNCSKEEIARNIWKYLQKLVNRDYTNPNTRKTAETFYKRNRSFVNSIQKNDEETFVKRILNIKGEKKWEMVKDYYYTLFHTIGVSGNKERYYLSTTISLDITNKFRKKGILLVGWVPNFYKRTIVYNSICTPNEQIKKLDLPCYERPFYPKQHEFCLKCGLLPHYIIGFISKDRFVVNPYFLKTKLTAVILKNGLNVDQEQFDKILYETNYDKAYIWNQEVFELQQKG